MVIRLGAVSYLNTRPLVYGLERRAQMFTVRFDVPARCAELLHAGDVDLGLIPSIEYGGRDYRIVPGLSIASDGPVASVALYTRGPLAAVRTIAADVSSRTSVALLRVLMAHWFHMSATLVPMAPDLDEMLRRCDAALVIGDNALFLDHGPLGLEKHDLGEAWKGLTSLPFVYAFWAGRPGVIGPEGVRALQEARDGGLQAVDDIAQDLYAGSDARIAVATAYLRDNVKYSLGEAEAAGLRRFYELAANIGAIDAAPTPAFYPEVRG